MAYQRYCDDPAFIAEFEEELADYVGRPSLVYYARLLSEEMGGARIFLKRLDLERRPHDVVITCVGGGSKAIGIFHPYIKHEDMRLIGFEAAGLGLDTGRQTTPSPMRSPWRLRCTVIKPFWSTCPAEAIRTWKR